MVYRNKDNSSPVRVDTLIGRETSFKGVFETPGGAVRIDGYFEGEFYSGGDLIVGETGRVNGLLAAKNITIAGEVRGTIEAKERLELTATAKIEGETKMAVLIVEDGAFIQGETSAISNYETDDLNHTMQVGPFRHNTVNSAMEKGLAKLKTP